MLHAALAWRSSDEDRWSEWAFGDAQTLLAVRHWERDGWIASKLLFVPQGHAPVIRSLDEPGLRQHAHGIDPATSPVGPRLRYTHYPAGYLVPYALLARAGLDSAPAARQVALAFSTAALVLMFLLFARLVGTGSALVAVVFYGLSHGHVGFASSLANQPLDDALRFGFMLAVVRSTAPGPEGPSNRASIVVWLLGFALSLVSLDSVLFAFVWLVGWDLLQGRGLQWRRWLAYACAPAAAHALQVAQNVWYLGVPDAVSDIVGTFASRHVTALTGARHVDPFVAAGVMLDHLLRPSFLIDASLLTYVVHRRYLLDEDDPALPRPGLVALMAVAGLAFPLVLPMAALMPYQGRQLGPFAAALVAGVAASLAHEARRFRSGRPGAAGRGSAIYLVVAGGLLIALGVTLVMGAGRALVAPGPDLPDAPLARQIAALQTAHAAVIMDRGGFVSFQSIRWAPGHPQISPLIEVLAGRRPVLCFDDPAALARDLGLLRQRAAAPFSPVVVARDEETMARIVRALVAARVIRGRPPVVELWHGRRAAALPACLE
ncbi:MAG: hypothetical protein HY815_08680 [Candidatus Riflebacteria bacterium]|nr:hypothetical protein [Candidatus Riflebacteria bacterium]